MHRSFNPTLQSLSLVVGPSPPVLHYRWSHIEVLIDGTISWQASVSNLGSVLNWRFINVVLYPDSFGASWRAKSQRDRVARQEEVQRQLRIYNTPNQQLGGRTPCEVMQLRPGNYEVKGQGFMTVWKDYIYFQKLSDHEDTNEALRWFLRRDIALPMAISLNSRQQNGLYKQALVATVLSMNGGFKLRPNGGPNSSLMKQAKALAKSRVENELKGLR